MRLLTFCAVLSKAAALHTRAVVSSANCPAGSRCSALVRRHFLASRHAGSRCLALSRRRFLRGLPCQCCNLQRILPVSTAFGPILASRSPYKMMNAVRFEILSQNYNIFAKNAVRSSKNFGNYSIHTFKTPIFGLKQRKCCNLSRVLPVSTAFGLILAELN